MQYTFSVTVSLILIEGNMAADPSELNPIKWSFAARIALLLMMLVGIVCGVIVGYIVYGIAQGADGGVSFEYWLSRPFRHASFWWAVLGAALGVAVGFIQRFISK